MLSLRMNLGINNVNNRLPPFKSDAEMLIDGTIIEDSGDYYFKDVSGNGHDLLITGYDWADRGIKGFPYKTAATISAPVGDAALIAEDLNNYFYDSLGAPNEIPVVSLFQDIDYEHKLFTKHSGQVLDLITGVELQEPYVKNIVLYKTVKVGADLVKCQVYFVVPDEDLTAKWISESGNDTTGTGTKAAPYATITKALAVNASKVYISTGTTIEANYILTGTKSIEVVGTGLTRLSGNNASYLILYAPNSTNTVSFKGCILDSPFAAVYAQSGSVNKSFESCLFNSSTRDVWGDNVEIELKYCILNKLIVGFNGLTLDTCLSNSTAGNSMAPGVAGNLPTIILNSAFLGGINSGNGTSNVTVKGITVAAGLSIQNTGDIDVSYSSFFGRVLLINSNTCEFNYNTIDLDTVTTSLLSVLDVVLGNITGNTINHKSITSNFHAVNIETSNVTISDNIVNTKNNYAGIYSIGDQINEFDFIATGNLITHTGLFGYGIGCGYEGEVSRDSKINAVIKENTIYGILHYTPTTTPSTVNDHAIFVGHTPKYDIRYNKVVGAGVGIVIKGSGETYANQKCQYNHIENCTQQIIVKGAEDVELYGNTIIGSIENRLRNISIINNAPAVGSINIKVKNNIIIDTAVTALSCLQFETESAIIASIDDIDNNIYYIPNSTIKEVNNPNYTTYELWLAAGYDANTLLSNPLLLNGIPQTGSQSIGAGENLGNDYRTGLDATTDWGSDTEVPAVVTRLQGDNWDIGAYVNSDTEYTYAIDENGDFVTDSEGNKTII